MRVLIARSRVFVSLALALPALLAGCGGGSNEPCASGAAGCACRPGNVCDDGLACDDVTLVCEGGRSVTLPPLDPAARSCEVLVTDDGGRAVATEFASSVRGESVRQAPRTAVTFHGVADAPLSPDAVRLRVAGEGDVHIERARCFDADGRALPEITGGTRG